MFIWNFNYGGFLGLWNGAGEMEALGELFFDNLATMLSITDLMLGFFLNARRPGGRRARRALPPGSSVPRAAPLERTFPDARRGMPV